LVELPGPVADLCVVLGALGGVEAVALGGSRATGTADAGSDWDLGLYYRGHPDFSLLARHGELHPPGSWGRIMNGGAWLRLDGLKVDVLLRDLDAAEHWSARARDGHYEVDALLGYVAGVPTYSLMAELALNRVVTGTLPRIAEFPPALARTGAVRWRQHAEFSLVHARMRAERGDVVGTVAQAAKAVVETAHGMVCQRREWVLNEKHLVERAGLRELHAQFTRVPPSAPGLVEWVDAVRGQI
jgi:Nucleotidyltransferase domain